MGVKGLCYGGLSVFDRPHFTELRLEHDGSFTLDCNHAFFFYLRTARVASQGGEWLKAWSWSTPLPNGGEDG